MSSFRPGEDSYYNSNPIELSSNKVATPNTAGSSPNVLGPALATANPYIIASAAAFQLIMGAQQADAIRKNAAIAKRVADLNDKYVELDAYNAEQAGWTREARYQSTIDKTIGEQKVALASKNVDVSFGTASEISADTKLTGFMNQLEIKNQASMKAMGYRVQGINARLQASIGESQAVVQAKAVETASYANTLTSLSGYAKGK